MNKALADAADDIHSFIVHARCGLLELKTQCVSKR